MHPITGTQTKAVPETMAMSDKTGTIAGDAHKRPCQLNKILVVDWRRVKISVADVKGVTW